MPFVAKYSTEQWAEARRLCAEGQTFPRIAEQLGFARPDSISRRARREGWLPGAKAKPAAKTSALRVGRLAPEAERARRALLLRVYGFMDLELRALEITMKKKLVAYETSPDAEPPIVTEKERASFAALIDNINKVTEMASEPALAADGRRKSASLNPELIAHSDELEPAALDAASEKDQQRADLAQQLAKAVGPA